MLITAEYFVRATGRKPVDDDLERVNCTKGCSQCGWNWEHNCPASKRTTTDAQRKLSCRFGFMIPGLEQIISGKIKYKTKGLCYNLQKLTDRDVYTSLKECFMLLGYGDTTYPIGSPRGDCWKDGRRRELAREVLALCRK